MNKKEKLQIRLKTVREQIEAFCVKEKELQDKILDCDKTALLDIVTKNQMTIEEAMEILDNYHKETSENLSAEPNIDTANKPLREEKNNEKII